MKDKVEIEVRLLNRIAEYYEFPFAVFLGNLKIFKHKTRNQALRKKADLFDKLRS